MITTRALPVLSFVSLAILSSACGSAPTEPSGEQSAALSGSGSCDVQEFEDCLDHEGGKSCAYKWCKGDCASDVYACVSGSGGQTCARRCLGLGSSESRAPNGGSCVRREELRTVGTEECGDPLTNLRGTANGRCVLDCDGTATTCTINHLTNGRPDCVVGVPLDGAGNPW